MCSTGDEEGFDVARFFVWRLIRNICKVGRCAKQGGVLIVLFWIEFIFTRQNADEIPHLIRWTTHMYTFGWWATKTWESGIDDFSIVLFNKMLCFVLGLALSMARRVGTNIAG